MSKRELNISDIKLHEKTPEDIILRSPMRIPSKEMQDLIALKNIKESFYAYYDIAETENQLITYRSSVRETTYGSTIGYTFEESKMFMGDIKE